MVDGNKFSFEFIYIIFGYKNILVFLVSLKEMMNGKGDILVVIEK